MYYLFNDLQQFGTMHLKPLEPCLKSYRYPRTIQLSAPTLSSQRLSPSARAGFFTSIPPSVGGSPLLLLLLTIDKPQISLAFSRTVRRRAVVEVKKSCAEKSNERKSKL